MRPRQLELGEIRLTLVDDGPIRLDGGAMFGVVPRVLWERHSVPDARHRVLLRLGCLLVESRGRRVLVDCGVGRKGDARFFDLFGIDTEATLLDSLHRVGVAPEDIDVVTNTHLHFDHSGWNTRLDGSGVVVPTFPHAEYVFQEEEWQVAVGPDERSAPAYPQDNFVPLRDQARALGLVRGEVELAPGVFTRASPGHTAAHQCVRIESGGRTAVFLGDLVPTPDHLPLVYHMAYDLFPLQLLETKREFLDRAFQDRWLLIFDHDPHGRIGTLRRGVKGRYELEPV